MRTIVPISVLGLAMAACTPQDAANLQNAAAITCNGAQIAAAAAVAISADIGSSAQAQADAAKAQKVTTDACAAVSKLPTVVAGAPAAKAQAIYDRWQRNMPASVLNSERFRAFIAKSIPP